VLINVSTEISFVFKQDIQELLIEWAPLLNSSALIFLSAPSHNKKIFLFPSSPIQKTDTRVRNIPFTTYRPTLVEIKRAHQILSTVEFFAYVPSSSTAADVVPTQDNNVPVIPVNTQPTQPVHQINNNATAAPDHLIEAISRGDLSTVRQLYSDAYERPLPEDARQITTPLFVACQDKKFDIVKFLVEEIKVDVNDLVPQWGLRYTQKICNNNLISSTTKQNAYSLCFFFCFRTALHRVAQDGQVNMIEYLLQHGANPCVKGMDGKFPADMAKDKETRNVFRFFCGSNPDLWDWYDAKATTGVPSLMILISSVGLVVGLHH
jgi:hypothetical protein